MIICNLMVTTWKNQGDYMQPKSHEYTQSAGDCHRGYHHANHFPTTFYNLNPISWVGSHPQNVGNSPPKPGCQSPPGWPSIFRLGTFLVIRESQPKPSICDDCILGWGGRPHPKGRSALEAPVASPGACVIWQAKALKNFMESAFPTVTLAWKQNSEFWAFFMTK